MRKIKKPTGESREATSAWAMLDTYAREQIQGFVQRLLDEEVEELLGRAKNERRSAETPAGSRNGHGKPRQLAHMTGTFTVRRPRERDVEKRFVSRVPLFKRQTTPVGALLPELYVHGLALGDFELAIRGMLGDAAPLSPSSILRVKVASAAPAARTARPS